MPKFTPTKPPAGCSNPTDHERAATALADKLDTAALKLLDESSPMLMSRAKEMSLAAIRARKLASEIAIKRLEVEQLEWLVAENRKLEDR